LLVTASRKAVPMNETKKQARVAGLLYLVLLVSAPLGLVYVPSKLFVSGDAAATAANIRAHELLLRMGVASELFHQVMLVFLVLALYRLFEPVSKALARQVVILGALVPIPIVFVNVLNELAALVLVSGAGFLSVFEPAQREALALLFVQLHRQGIGVVEIFWGLWLFPFGLLVMRCGFIPRVLGVLMMIAGSGYLAASITGLVLPDYSRTVGGVAQVLELGEIPIILWLVIFGARAPARAA
jgi:Domain of unknown function (DUF4386)